MVLRAALSTYAFSAGVGSGPRGRTPTMVPMARPKVAALRGRKRPGASAREGRKPPGWWLTSLCAERWECGTRYRDAH